MRHLNDDEYSKRVKKLTPNARLIYDDGELSWNEMKVKVHELWLLYFIGTQYQEKYCTDFIEQLMELIQEKVNESIIAKYKNFIKH
ncbi:hypothetical protein PBI_121Q_325 [Escherichia phage 121Q]|uniref:Uncharacterized protein n=1 Tax=Escherichia phage 121Q TaxID=1555202 RepID=A0A097EXT3_9CAUD|nr:hypothetical protein PBI_121Q_325 [Escherichia phage 121Q]AIT14215.1 hypothetical protein PBI_121Q_325 [Escherichia phage 121Q]